MTPEAEIVLLLCRRPLEHRARARLGVLLPSVHEWEPVFELARRWEVEPAVFSNLRALDDPAVPARVLREADGAEQRSRARALAGTLRSVELVRTLEAAGIPTILLKGAALGVAAYDDPSFRSFADVDLLVHRHHLSAAGEILSAAGYDRDFDTDEETQLAMKQHALEFSDQGKKVELHWTLLSRHLLLDFDVHELWLESIRVEVGGIKVRALSIPHLFLFVCAHGAKHEWERVRWLCDVAQLSDRLTENEMAAVVALANRAHARDLLVLALNLVREVFDIDVSRFAVSTRRKRALSELAIAARQRMGIRADRVIQAPSSRQLDPRARTLWFWIRARERLIDRVACIAFVLCSPRPTDIKSAFQLLKRPFRLAILAARQVGF